MPPLNEPQEDGDYYNTVFEDESEFEEIRSYGLTGNPSSPSIAAQLSKNPSSPSSEKRVSENTSSPDVSGKHSENTSSPAVTPEGSEGRSDSDLVGEVRMGRNQSGDWRIQSVRTRRDEGRENAQRFAENIVDQLES